MVENLIILSERSNIRKRPPRPIIVPFPFLAMLLKVRFDRIILIRRPGKVLREATTRQLGRDFRRVSLCGAHGRHPRTTSRERGQEAHCFGPVVGLARLSWPGVARGGEDGYAAGAELAKEVADLLGVGAGHDLFVYAVGEGDDGGEG